MKSREPVLTPLKILTVEILQSRGQQQKRIRIAMYSGTNLTRMQSVQPEQRVLAVQLRQPRMLEILNAGTNHRQHPFV